MVGTDNIDRPAGPIRSDPLAPFVVSFKALAGREVLATADAERPLLSGGVRRVGVRERGLFGPLFLPARGAAHPAITVLGGSAGGLNEYVAALYAGHGYASLALAYCN